MYYFQAETGNVYHTLAMFIWYKILSHYLDYSSYVHATQEFEIFFPGRVGNLSIW